MPPAASGWWWRSTASRGGRWWRTRIKALSLDLAPRRGGCGRQDRRRGRHPRADPGRRSSRTRCGGPGTSRAASGWRSGRSSCRATTSAAQETARTVVETEVLRMGYYIYGWRHVPVDISVPRAEGERHPAGDRADPDLERQGRRRGDLRARALRHPAADREGGGGDPRLLRLLDELPVDHLQGDDAGRARSSIFYPTCRTRASRAPSRSITSAIRPTPSRAGGWRSRSGCWRTTARSTR